LTEKKCLFEVIPEKPEVEFDTKTLEAKVGETLKISASVTGLPQPKISWYKNGIPVGAADGRPAWAFHARTADTFAEIKGLVEMTKYHFRVTAENALGNGPPIETEQPVELMEPI
uniref:Ig-like domain-containing protein n=1 Tax=Parascaris equorum TaxID=6256 RepID=A0A914R2E8_PAREQ